MNVIDHNPDKTVGVVEGVESLNHIGGFSLELLVEWVKTINATFETDRTTTIHLFTKKSGDVDSYALFASAEGKDPMVVVSGKIPGDGKPWGDVRG